MSRPDYNEWRLSDHFKNVFENRKDERFYVDENIQKAAKFQAKAIIDGATDLVADNSVSQAFHILDYLQEDSGEDAKKNEIKWYVYEIIDELLGHEVVEMQVRAEKRILKLVALMEKQGVDAEIRHFLNEATKCYLYGFDIQCIIMCRSVLDAYFEQLIPDNTCRDNKACIDDKEKYYVLADRIKVAEYIGMISQGLDTEFLRKIKDAANKQIHPSRWDKKSNGCSRIHVTEEFVWDILVRTVLVIKNIKEHAHG